MGHCICADLVAVEGKEQSCPECAAAWNRKRGKIPGVDAVEVITFGVYRYENEGKHYHPLLKGEEKVEGEQVTHEERRVEEVKAHEGIHETGVEHSH